MSTYSGVKLNTNAQIKTHKIERVFCNALHVHIYTNLIKLLGIFTYYGTSINFRKEKQKKSNILWDYKVLLRFRLNEVRLPLIRRPSAYSKQGLRCVTAANISSSVRGAAVGPLVLISCSLFISCWR